MQGKPTMVQGQHEDMALRSSRYTWAAFDAGEKTPTPANALSWQAAGLTGGQGSSQELQI